MQEEKKDSIILVREAQTAELKEDYDGAVAVIVDQKEEITEKDHKIKRRGWWMKGLGLAVLIETLILVIILL